MDESERIALTVEPAFSGMRLDAYLREQTPFSRSRIVSLMEEGAMVVNGEIERKAARKTEEGMQIILNVPETKPVGYCSAGYPAGYPLSGCRCCCRQQRRVAWSFIPPPEMKSDTLGQRAALSCA